MEKGRSMYLIILAGAIFSEGSFAKKIETTPNSSFTKKMCHTFQRKIGETGDGEIVTASSNWSWFKIASPIKIDEGFGPKKVRSAN